MPPESTGLDISSAQPYDTLHTVVPTQSYLPQPYPGEFFGFSTRPTMCTDLTNALICLASRVPIINGRFGDTPSNIDPSEFLAWSESSRFTLARSGGGDTIDTLRQINLFFYHEPALGIGLPELTLSVSVSDTDIGSSLTYTILNNQDLTLDDAQVHIAFALTNSIRQFAISEIQLCADQGKLTIKYTPFQVFVIQPLLKRKAILWSSLVSH